ncbi:unnamed protein product, partial [Prorocentrum cordatum]
RVCMRSDGRKKIHTTFPDGGEMVEEYDERTDVLLLRKTRRPTKLGGEGNWNFEVGQAPEPGFDPHSDLMRTSSTNPIFLRKDTPEHFQWRIRNLAYPVDVYPEGYAQSQPRGREPRKRTRCFVMRCLPRSASQAAPWNSDGGPSGLGTSSGRGPAGSVSVDHDKQEVVVRTSNKKYYKRIGVPDLARCGKASSCC